MEEGKRKSWKICSDQQYNGEYQEIFD